MCYLVFVIYHFIIPSLLIYFIPFTPICAQLSQNGEIWLLGLFVLIKEIILAVN
jgi:hypothetical protein